MFSLPYNLWEFPRNIDLENPDPKIRHSSTYSLGAPTKENQFLVLRPQPSTWGKPELATSALQPSWFPPKLPERKAFSGRWWLVAFMKRKTSDSVPFGCLPHLQKVFVFFLSQMDPPQSLKIQPDSTPPKQINQQLKSKDPTH